MKKTFYIIFIIVFFVICLVPSVGLAVSGPSPAAANEVPAVVPSVKNYDDTWNWDYFSDWQDYMGNTFYTRLACITGWDTICARVFHTSVNDDVILGPDGWLFYGTAANDLAGVGQMTDREIWACARSLYLMQEYTESQGANFVFAMPGSKYMIYSDHAPNYVTVEEGSNRTRLLSAMEEEGIHYVDLTETFLAQEEVLCWQWDSHWNGKGAALAADTILAALGRESNYFDGPFDIVEDHQGDLYEMLFPLGSARETDYVWSAGWNFSYTSSFKTSDDITITTENSAGEGSLLLFRDSSGRNLYPYLSEIFASAYISRLNNYRLDYIAEEGADTVVVELAERTLDYILKYPAVYPAPVRDMAVLTGAVFAESEMEVDTSGSTMEGYAKITGTLPETSIDSCVYILADEKVYEAIPGQESFTAYLPLEAVGGDIEVYIFQ